MFTPHVMSWTTEATSGGVDPVSGFPVDGLPGVEMNVACRFYDGGNKSGIKELKNQDNTMVLQKGKIRLDVGSEMPDQFREIIVTDGGQVIFTGRAMNIYRGQITWRIDV